jgi:hypothetical protein
MRARCLTFLACLACGVLVAGVASCSAAPTSSGGGGESTGAASATNVGTAEFELTIGSGVLVSAVTYSLTGPGNFSERGTVDVSHSDTVSVLLGGLLPGSGYVVSLQAQSIGGAFTCSGQSAPFAIAAQQTTPVGVALACSTGGADAGTVTVTATGAECPTIDQVSALPAIASVGGSMSLLGAARGLDPGALVYAWTATGGSMANASSPDATFTCTAIGPMTIDLSVSDGSDAAGCSASQAVTVTCTQ